MPVASSNFLVWIARCFVFLVALVPLIVANSLFFPYITGRGFFFRIVVSLALGLWFVLAVWDKNYRPRRGWLLYAVGALLLFSLLATIFGLNPTRSFWSNFERLEGLLLYLYLGAYFVLLVSLMKTERQWWWLWLTHLAVGALVSLYGLLQLFGGWQTGGGASRLGGTLGNPAYLAGYLLFLFFLTLFLNSRRPAGWPAWPFFVLAGLEAIVIYFTATRGALLGLLVGVITAAALYWWRGPAGNPWRRRAGWGLLGLVLLIAAFFAWRQTDFVRSSEPLARLASISLDDATTRARLTIWQMAWRGFLERPLVGWGPENFIAVFSKYYEPSMYGQEPWFDRAHNIFLDWLVGAGVLGLLAYLLLYAASLYLIWRRLDFSVSGRSWLTGLLVAYGAHNFFVFDNLTSYLLFFTLLAYLHERSGPRQSEARNPAYALFLWLAGLLALLWLVFSLWWLNGRPLALAYDLISAIHPQTPLTERAHLWEKLAADAPPLGRTELREQLVQGMFALLARDSSLPAAEKESLMALTVKELETEVANSPGNPRPELFLGSFYARLGRHDEALTSLRRGLALSPRRQLFLFELGDVYLAKSDLPAAFDVFEQAFRLDERSDEARRRYVLGLVLTRQFSTADQVLLAGFGTTTVPDPSLINAYAEVKKFDRVLELWIARAATEPENFDFQISLAAAYYANGQRSESVQVLERAQTLKPAAASQITELIQGVRAGTIDL